MMKLLLPTLMLIPTIWLTPAKWLWPSTLAQSFVIAALSLIWATHPTEAGWTSVNLYLATDPVSKPLIILTCWLLPLMILASQSHATAQPTNQQRTYLILLTSIQAFLILAFSATELMMFYIMFEATLIPTLILITRWGTQMERLSAGVYFLFYTLAGSLPLLVALLLLKKDVGGLCLLTYQLTGSFSLDSYAAKLWWAGCIIAFLVKMPLYGTHLWLPKAHVEAPVAGSMILAAVLLKLGGYGMIRMMPLLEPITKDMAYPFMALGLWGIIMTSTTCLRQVDLKSLIAYSSVSHMGLVVGGILAQTPWGLAGSVILMIAHGLTSSTLFCLANMNYERVGSRVMILARGLQTLLPLMATWWFVAALANLSLPPLPNFTGELMIITSLFTWSHWTILLTGAATVITVNYTLFMFLMTQRGSAPSFLILLDPSSTREHLVVFLHLLPLMLLILKPELISAWLT
nr:NADH dehydrogenase subunit 4 [Taenianotus triacanthus]